MPPLDRIQDDFQRFLLRGDAAIEHHVVGTERVPVSVRLGIYSGGYGARLTEALQTNYPVLAQLLGESDFEELAAAYIRSHDSSYTSIRYYGKELEEFLTQDATYAEVPLLAELARWEWAMTAAFDASDSQPLGVEALARVPAEQWADLRFEWHPSIRRLQLTWNVPQIWNAITRETERPDPSVAAEPGQWLIWRRELATFFRSVSPSEAAALDAARCGGSFGELCDLLCGLLGEADAPAQAAGFLREWLQSGLIVKLT